MNRCIITKYVGPTNTRGARIIAKAHGKTVTCPWRYEEDAETNHAMAASRMLFELGWNRGMAWERHSSLHPDGASYVHILERCDDYYQT